MNLISVIVNKRIYVVFSSVHMSKRSVFANCPHSVLELKVESSGSDQTERSAAVAF